MVKVFLASVLRSTAPSLNGREFPDPEGTVADLLERIAAAGPDGFRARIFEGTALRRYLAVYVDGTDIRFTGGLATPIGAAGRVDLIPAVAGG
ncbi:MAG: MoaD/ThiS family protein [Thermoplasmata archaeon]